MESEAILQNLKTVLNDSLNKSNRNTRRALANILKEKIFTPVYDISLREMKSLAQERLKKVMSTKVVSVKDFLTDPENIFTTHEILGYSDSSLATKFTVQFNLFGGTIVGLGTKEHEKLYDYIDSLKVMGCFCLTELGYGNNAVEMETRAVWDENEKVFVINTPTVLSQKYWITNGAYYANWAVVFAQTDVNGKAEGINAFLVKLRDDKMSLCEGVTIDDMGCKQGMNGVDNARIILKNVKIPRENLLNKLADISPEGIFKSQISNRRQRFLAASNRLLSGRLCIASMSIAGTKLALLITSKYGTVRLSNGKSGKSDAPISSLGLFSTSLVPLIARTIVLNIGLLHIRKIYSDYLLNMDKYSNIQFNNVVRLVCAIKPLVAWHANKTGNLCRERCGGMGYLSINRIEEQIPFAHASITAEGDSAVLIHKVSKEYVDDFSKNLIPISQPSLSEKQLSEVSDLLNIEVLQSLIKHREISLLKILSDKTMRNNKGIFDLWMMNESDLIQDLGKTFGERICLEESVKKLGGSK
jgi:acyl-CoA oxidase